MQIPNQGLSNTISEFGQTTIAMPGGLWRPPWSYSIGLFKTYGLPEVVLLGREREIASSMMSRIYNEVRAGTQLADGIEVASILLDQVCIFRAIDEKHYKKYLPWAVDFYGNTGFPALQCIWPDMRGVYPWQAGHDKKVRRFQPFLFSP